VEVRDLVTKIWRPYRLVLLLSVLLAGVTYFVSKNLPASFRASGLLFVTRQADSSSTNYFTYEGFYSQQTAERYTDSVLGILKSDQVKKLALDSLNLPSSSPDVKRFGNNTLVQKTGPQLLSVTISAGDSDTSKSLWQALADQTVKSVSAVNQSGDSKITVQVMNQELLIAEVTPKPWLYGLAAFLGLGGLGLLGLAIWEYLKQ